MACHTAFARGLCFDQLLFALHLPAYSLRDIVGDVTLGYRVGVHIASSWLGVGNTSTKKEEDDDM